MTPIPGGWPSPPRGPAQVGRTSSGTTRLPPQGPRLPPQAPPRPGRPHPRPPPTRPRAAHLGHFGDLCFPAAVEAAMAAAATAGEPGTTEPSPRARPHRATFRQQAGSRNRKRNWLGRPLTSFPRRDGVNVVSVVTGLRVLFGAWDSGVAGEVRSAGCIRAVGGTSSDRLWDWDDRARTGGSVKSRYPARGQEPSYRADARGRGGVENYLLAYLAASC